MLACRELTEIARSPGHSFVIKFEHNATEVLLVDCDVKLRNMSPLRLAHVRHWEWFDNAQIR